MIKQRIVALIFINTNHFGNRCRLCKVEKGEVAAVAFGFHAFGRDETERRGVDAVAQPSLFGGAIGKDVAKVGSGGCGFHLGADAPERGVGRFIYQRLVNGMRECGPATPRIIFARRHEERCAVNDVNIYAGAEFVVIFVDVGALGGPVLRHFPLQRSEPLAQFLLTRLVGAAFRLFIREYS